MNRFRAFGGIDCHSIFGEILSTLRGMSLPAAVASAVSIPRSQAGNSLTPLISERFRRSDPKRSSDISTAQPLPGDTLSVLTSPAERRLERLPHALRKSEAPMPIAHFNSSGAAGRRGQTILLQAAASAAKSGGWNVLWRPAPRVSLPPEHISTLDPAKHWLVVADDAENLVRELSEAARLLHEVGRSHVHFLLAARDTDWRYFHGDRQPWGTLLQKHPDILLRELQTDDANMLVAAWRKSGDDGLRELASLPNTDKQVTASSMPCMERPPPVTKVRSLADCCGALRARGIEESRCCFAHAVEGSAN